jgi:glycosyltransferase involved in cell wall biosynthesis
MIAAFRRLAQELEPEVVVVDNYAAGWVSKLFHAVPGKPALIYIAHNFEEKLAADIARGFTGTLPRRCALNLNARKIRTLERSLAAKSDLIVALTEHDRDELLVRHPGKPSLVLPPGFSGYRADCRVIDATVPRRVVMLGSVRWIAKQINVAEFLEAADVKFYDAGITFDIIGDVDEEFRAKWSPRLRSTRFLGFVDDLAAELANTRLGLIVEAVGGGFKLKILDYLFARVPVAALAGSFEGIPKAARDEILIRPTADRLADAVVAVIDDLPTLNRMQDRCFDAVRNQFNWESNGRALAEALRDLCAG